MKKDRLFTPLTFAFLLSVSAFLLFLAFYGVLGFGNNTIFRGDLYVQYVDFIELFLRVLKGKEDFWYTFSQYYGSPSILTYAYYAFSPLNLLYLLDFISIPAMTIIIITIKIGTSAENRNIISQLLQLLRKPIMTSCFVSVHI